MTITMDLRDLEILEERAQLLEHASPQVGDFVVFADGVTRRISHVWAWSLDGSDTPSYQTSDYGHFYLGNGYVSFSGSLFPSVNGSALCPTDQLKTGSVWIFHHDYATAGGGIDTAIDFPVWTCSENAPH